MTNTIDTVALKRDHPVEDVIARYGIVLRPQGRSLVGRCPFHQDQGRPNLHVYPGNGSWYCYRCALGGDVIRFVERIEGVGFRAAVELLDGTAVPRWVARPRALPPTKPRSRRQCVLGLDERACLAAAAEVYHNRLLAEPRALDYVVGRGIDRATIETCRLGYASGDELLAYLCWRRLPIQAARRLGLLGRNGQEFLAGRVVVPEIRDGQPIWLIGRIIGSDASAPKYLGLPGRKPLLGWGDAASQSEAWVVEGVFDLLTLRSWGLPALALVGTQVRAETVALLGRFARVYLALDNDSAGREATARLCTLLGARAIPIALPGVKDVAELAPYPNGRDRLLGALAAVPRAA